MVVTSVLCLCFCCLFYYSELGGIPVLVRLLDHELEEIHRSAAACLLNLSYSKSRDENKVIILFLMSC